MSTTRALDVYSLNLQRIDRKQVDGASGVIGLALLLLLVFCGGRLSSIGRRQ